MTNHDISEFVLLVICVIPVSCDTALQSLSLIDWMYCLVERDVNVKNMGSRAELIGITTATIQPSTWNKISKLKTMTYFSDDAYAN